MKKAAHFIAACGMLGAALHPGCAGSGAGWDVDALQAEEPGLADLPGHRLGDMTPYPAIENGRVVLVACRFSGEQPIRVVGGGDVWPREWARVAVNAFDRVLEPVDLRLAEAPTGSAPSAGPMIELVLVESAGAAGPSGLGDTLAECDVSRSEEEGSRIRGRITGAEIRMRRSRRSQTGLVKWATDEEWIGALMHELGHAVGFAGHATAGSSLLLLEQSRLRGFGRSALSGRPLRDPTLEALYRIPPGQLLGEARLSAAAQHAAQQVESLARIWQARFGPADSLIAHVGDRAARIRWRWRAPERSLELIFPDWRRELRSGRAVTAQPGSATRRALALEEAADSDGP